MKKIFFTLIILLIVAGFIASSSFALNTYSRIYFDFDPSAGQRLEKTKDGFNLWGVRSTILEEWPSFSPSKLWTTNTSAGSPQALSDWYKTLQLAQAMGLGVTVSFNPTTGEITAMFGPETKRVDSLPLP